MPRYKVTVKFDRTNPETNDIETNQVRESVFESENEESAKTEYLERVKENEPTLTEIKEVSVFLEALDEPGTEENIDEEDAG